VRSALLLACFLATLPAAELPKEVSLSSPDGRFQAVVLDHAPQPHTCEIRSATGDVIFRIPPSDPNPAAWQPAPFPDYFLWSADSRILALISTDRRVATPLLYAWTGSTFVSIRFPALTDEQSKAGNSWIAPVAWGRGHRLTVEISPAHHGKSNGAGARGHAIIAVDLATHTARLLDEKIRDRPPQPGWDTGEPPALLHAPTIQESEISAGYAFGAIHYGPWLPSQTRTWLSVQIEPFYIPPAVPFQIAGPDPFQSQQFSDDLGFAPTAPYVLSPSRRTLAYTARLSTVRHTIGAVTITPDRRIASHPSIDADAQVQIARTKAGRHLFPTAAAELYWTVASVADDRVTLLAPLPISSTGEPSTGNPKTTRMLECTVRLLPDSKTKVASWDIYEE
jgi:hypothetical protein